MNSVRVFCFVALLGACTPAAPQQTTGKPMKLGAPAPKVDLGGILTSPVSAQALIGCDAGTVAAFVNDGGVDGAIQNVSVCMPAALPPAYGEMIVLANNSGQALTNQLQPLRVAWGKDQAGYNVIVNPDAGTLSPTVGGQYRIEYVASVGESAADVVHLQELKNDAAIPTHIAAFVASTTVSNVTVSGIDHLKPGDVIQIAAQDLTADASTLTVYFANFTIVKVGP